MPCSRPAPSRWACTHFPSTWPGSGRRCRSRKRWQHRLCKRSSLLHKISPQHFNAPLWSDLLKSSWHLSTFCHLNHFSTKIFSCKLDQHSVHRMQLNILHLCSMGIHRVGKILPTKYVYNISDIVYKNCSLLFYTTSQFCLFALALLTSNLLFVISRRLLLCHWSNTNPLFVSWISSCH